MPAAVLVPLRERGRHVHLLDDLPPADPRVVGAEGNLALLRAVGDDAHLRAAEVVVEQVLEPHARDEQEGPGIRTPALDVGQRATLAYLAVVAFRGAERLVELLEERLDAEARRRLERVVVAHQRHGDANHRQELPARGVVDERHVLRQLLHVEKRGDGRRLVRLLVDHHRHADAAVRVAAACQRAPVGLRAVDQVREVGERAHERDREPVAGRLADAGLVLHVVGEVRQRVALRGAALVRHLLVAAGERHGLEREERDLLRVVDGELDDAAHLLVVDAVHQRHDEDDVHAGAMEVLDGAQLDVEQVADVAVRVGRIADAVELQVDVSQAGLGRLAAELGALGELDAIGRRLHAVVAHLLRVRDGLQEVGRERRLPA